MLQIGLNEMLDSRASRREHARLLAVEFMVDHLVFGASIGYRSDHVSGNSIPEWFQVFGDRVGMAIASGLVAGLEVGQSLGYLANVFVFVLKSTQ